MPDPYATIADADVALQERLSDVLELRAADSQQRAMLRAYVSEISLPRGSRALEVGCGTGAVSRVLVEAMNFEVTGIDPSPVFVARARELGKHLPGLTFMPGDGRSLTQPDASLTWSCSTRRFVTFPIRRRRFAKRIASCVLMDGWPYSTAITRRRLWRSASSIRFRRLYVPWSPTSSTTHG